MNIKHFIFSTLMMGTLLFSFGASKASAQAPESSDNTTVLIEQQPSPQAENSPEDNSPVVNIQADETAPPSPVPSPSTEPTPENSATQATPAPFFNTPAPIINNPIPQFSLGNFFNNFFDQFLGTRFQASLDGGQEVPGPGDPNGAGRVLLEIYQESEKLCVGIKATGLDQPVAAHIHKAPYGIAGEVVVLLPTPSWDGVASGCVSVDDTLLKEIRKSPFNYYVNIHTTTYPNGAIRGQLFRR